MDVSGGKIATGRWPGCARKGSNPQHSDQHDQPLRTRAP